MKHSRSYINFLHTYIHSRRLIVASVFVVQVLCAVLEYEVCDSADLKMQIITTLQSTSRGKGMYSALCERQIQLRELVASLVECCDQ